MRLIMSSAKYHPFCLGLNVFTMFNGRTGKNILSVMGFMLWQTNVIRRNFVSWQTALIARFMGQHRAHLGPTGPKGAPYWPHELCFLGSYETESTRWLYQTRHQNSNGWIINYFETPLFRVPISQLPLTHLFFGHRLFNKPVLCIGTWYVWCKWN